MFSGRGLLAHGTWNVAHGTYHTKHENGSYIPLVSLVTRQVQRARRTAAAHPLTWLGAKLLVVEGYHSEDGQ